MTGDLQNSARTKDSSVILIVEDSPTQAEHLRFILEKRGYKVTAARNGCEAIAAVTRNPPALVVSDIMMPEMDGYELCSHLKGDPRSAKIPVILLTTLTDPVDVLKGLECGADNFIFKPCDEEHLIARIARMLSQEPPHHEETVTSTQPVEVDFANQHFLITSDRSQILNLLLSTYEAAVQRNRMLAAAKDELRRLNESLEARVRERTAALEMEIAERKRAGEEVHRLNAELERRVAERTASLQIANEELEAFSYSVSHDLRTPLRHIDGFAGLLAKSTTDNLPENGRRYLQSITSCVRTMGQLIDDLLSFSRTSRAELRMGCVDLQALANESLHELAPEMAGRNIRWEFGSLPHVRGDRRLLMQVFLNLFSNAIKYTRPRDPAEIHVGAHQERPGEVVVHVRDNGVGFDMRYVGKLFGVFQRLHLANEFEGTGIGLANVRRIIARHGGRTWAESRVNDGAIFYFSLSTADTEMVPDRVASGGIPSI